MQTINDQSFTVAVKAAMIKGLVHPKMKILSSITHPHVAPNPQDVR